MDATQRKIERLKRMVETARQEIELAVMFHETWRPAAYDTDLHDRIGTSYAAHAFQIIRISLRRELLLALARLWDKDSRAVGMRQIASSLRDPKFFEALVQFRARSRGLRSMFNPDPVREALTTNRDLVLDLIDKYDKGGSAYKVWEKMKRLRNERLAHRQLPKAPLAIVGVETSGQPSEEGGGPVWATDDEIEEFYQDNLEIVRLLMSLVEGIAFDLQQAAKVYKSHAKFFWASARGERTEGHPAYRPSSLISQEKV